jgi:hypothetical protein
MQLLRIAGAAYLFLEDTMKKIAMTIASGLLLSLSVSAAQIYGSLKEDRRPVANAKFQVVCAGQKPVDGITDSYGAYTVYVGKGKCIFQLTSYKGQAVKFEPLYSYDKPLRYDFDLVVENGVYKLRRR